MLPLSLDDLLPLEEYAARRHEFFQSHCRYLDRYRRMRVGPAVAFVFENRQTLWFRVQEVLLIARLRRPSEIQIELDSFNRLLPGPGQLQASLLITPAEQGCGLPDLSPWETMSENDIHFSIGKDTFQGLLSCARPEDRCLGVAHWVQFDMGLEGCHLLENPKLPAYLEIAAAKYRYQSAPIGEEIRESLLDDLRAVDTSERAAA